MVALVVVVLVVVVLRAGVVRSEGMADSVSEVWWLACRLQIFLTQSY